MVRLNRRKINLNSVFEFAADKPNFDLIDILNEGSTTKKFAARNFLSDRGYFVYRSCLIVNDRQAELYGIEGLNFSFYRVDPRKNRTGPTNRICNYEIEFKQSDRENKRVAGVNKTKEARASTFKDSYMRVFATNRIAPAGLNARPTPPTRVEKSPILRDVTKIAKIEGLDPAALSAVGNFATQTVASSMSLDSKNLSPPNFAKIVSSSPEMITKTSLSALRQTKRNSRRGLQRNIISRRADTLDRADSRTSTTSFDFLPIRRVIEQDFHIDKKNLRGSSDFFVEVTAIRSKKKDSRVLKYNFTNFYQKIQHRNELNEYLANPEPPNVKVLRSTRSDVTFEITREDPTLTRVKGFRVIENPYSIDASVSDIGTYNFDKKDTIVVTDAVDNVLPNKITYRFIAVNGDASLGEFTSVIVPTIAKPSDPSNSAATPISIFAINQGRDNIKITVDILDDNILSFRLLRQELGKTGEYSNSITQIRTDQNEDETLVSNQKGSYTFLDRETVLGKKYRYFLAYRVGSPGFIGISQETQSDEDEIIIRRFSYEAAPFAIKVSDPTINTDASGFSAVNFKIDITETTELFNTVIEALRAAGIGEDFISSLQSDKIKAKNFVMMIVERYNTLTGKRTSFGIRPVGDFSDNDITRQQLSIPPPAPNVPYRYIFKACLQDPRVFLQSTDVELVNTFGTQIKRKGTRFTRKIFTRLGVLPSETDVLNGTSINRLIEESQLGIEIEKSTTVKQNAIKIQNTRLKTKTYFNLLSWSTLGDFSQVSYFNVYCTIDGKKNLLGAISTSFESSTYKFRDDRYFSDVGSKKYEIEAVSFAGEVVAVSDSIEATKETSVPDNLLNGVAFIDSLKRSRIVPMLASNQRRARGATSSKPISSGDASSLRAQASGDSGVLRGVSAQSSLAEQPWELLEKLQGNTHLNDPNRYWNEVTLPSFNGTSAKNDPFNQSSPRGAINYPNSQDLSESAERNNLPLDDRSSTTLRGEPEAIFDIGRQARTGKIII